MMRLILGDSAKVLKKVEHDSVDLVVTDPPYGYGFMGKDWDAVLPDIEIFKQCFRVLKPGAFAFVMSAPRSDVFYRMMQRLEESGFEIAFTPIFWTYATGFPKATNISKAVDKKLGAEREVVGFDERSKGIRPGSHHIVGDVGYETGHPITAPASDQAKALEGSYAGFQPKPAVEVIIVAMKPLSEKNYVEQALSNQKGVTWLDDCRIPYKETDSPSMKGRFPANLLVSDDVLNDGKISSSNSGGMRKASNEFGQTSGWNDHENKDTIRQEIHDSGSFSRYFDLDAWAKTFPFLIVPKASKSERNEGMENLPTVKKASHMQTANGTSGERSVETGFPDTFVKNFHPTVKPLKLMAYLITLGSRKGDLVLDPFNGSGTTGVAAKELGRDYLGVEIMPPYIEISKARIGECEVETDEDWIFQLWMKEEMEKLGIDVSKYQLQMVTGVKEVEKIQDNITASRPESTGDAPLSVVDNAEKPKYRLVMKKGKYVMVK